MRDNTDNINEELDDQISDSQTDIQNSGVSVDPEDCDELNQLTDKLNVDSDELPELEFGEK